MARSLKSAELVIIGDELVSGAVPDVNVAYLTSKLLAIGLSVSRVTITGDEPLTLEQVLFEALDRSALVISSGGLGPTSDDRTRTVAASVFGRTLSLDKKLLERIRKRYEKMGRKLSELGESQALVPQGAKLLVNPVGAAPGIILSDNRRTLILLPGVPSEVKAVTDPGLLEYIQKNYMLNIRHTLIIRTSGKPETDIEERLTPFLNLNKDLKISYLPKFGMVDLRIEASAKTKLNSALRQIKKILGADIYAVGEKSLAEVAGELLCKRKSTLAVAESCTAGMLASTIVDAAGSSRYFLGGVVSYSNEAKEAFLDVPHALISKHGAVSSEVALAMAEGVRRRFGSTHGLSITGVAGPAGGTRDKPVGLVYIGLSAPGKTKVIRTMFPSYRNLIRARSVTVALDMLRRILVMTQKAF